MWKGKIELSLGFLILLGWFALANGVYLTGLMILAAVLHELGHYMALRWHGVSVRRLSISVLGAEMEGDMDGLGYGEALVCLLAGVWVNLLCALVFSQVWPVFAGVHLTLCLFNSLPVRPLDGGRALELALRWRFDPTISQGVSRWVGRIVAGLMAMGLGYLVWVTGGSLWLVPAGLAFFMLMVMPR